MWAEAPHQGLARSLTPGLLSSTGVTLVSESCPNWQLDRTNTISIVVRSLPRDDRGRREGEGNAQGTREAASCLRQSERFLSVTLEVTAVGGYELSVDKSFT